MQLLVIFDSIHLVTLPSSNCFVCFWIPKQEGIYIEFGGQNGRVGWYWLGCGSVQDRAWAQASLGAEEEVHGGQQRPIFRGTSCQFRPSFCQRWVHGMPVITNFSTKNLVIYRIFKLQISKGNHGIGWGIGLWHCSRLQRGPKEPVKKDICIRQWRSQWQSQSWTR